MESSTFFQGIAASPPGEMTATTDLSREPHTIPWIAFVI